MALSTDALEAELHEKKQRLRETIAELGDAARTTVSWRNQLEERPLAMLSAAAAVGLVAGALMYQGRRHDEHRFSRDPDAYRWSDREDRSRVHPRRRRRLNPVVKRMLLLAASRAARVAEDALRERIARGRSPRDRPRQKRTQNL